MNSRRVKERENRYIADDMQTEKLQIELFDRKTNEAVGVKNHQALLKRRIIALGRFSHAHILQVQNNLY